MLFGSKYCLLSQTFAQLLNPLRGGLELSFEQLKILTKFEQNPFSLKPLLDKAFLDSEKRFAQSCSRLLKGFEQHICSRGLSNSTPIKFVQSIAEENP